MESRICGSLFGSEIPNYSWLKASSFVLLLLKFCFELIQKYQWLKSSKRGFASLWSLVSSRFGGSKPRVI
jgi:hypothetical protein